MPLNKQKGNMYSFITHTWNPIKGRCAHNCKYCYMKKWGKQNPVHLDDQELKTHLGYDNFIFVGSSTDIFANNIPDSWISEVIKKVNFFRANRFLFQTKNVARMAAMHPCFNRNTVLGTTIETNRWEYNLSDAPSAKERAEFLRVCSALGHATMVTIEPVCDFDLDKMLELVLMADPWQINIGAATGKHNLPEPEWDKVQALIRALEGRYNVHLKSNLNRLKYNVEHKRCLTK